MDPESFYGVKHIEWDEKVMLDSHNYVDFCQHVEPELNKMGVRVYRWFLPYSDKYGWYPVNFPYSYEEYKNGPMVSPYMMLAVKIRNGRRVNKTVEISHSLEGYEDAIMNILPDYIRWDGNDDNALEANFFNE